MDVGVSQVSAGFKGHNWPLNGDAGARPAAGPTRGVDGLGEWPRPMGV